MRLLLSDIGVTYSDLDKMDQHDVGTLNAALDISEEQMKKKAEK